MNERQKGLNDEQGGGIRFFSLFLRLFIPAVAVCLLLMFMVFSRVYNQSGDLKTLTKIESLDVKPTLAAPPPPPLTQMLSQPASLPTPPSPKQLQKLPELELATAPDLPALLVAIEKQNLEIEMKTTDFRKVLKTPPPQKTYTKPAKTNWKPQPKSKPKYYTAKSLDFAPSLVFKPNVKFPSSLKNRGIWRGRVVLEVTIDAYGRVHIIRALSSSHKDLIPVAYNFASRARFTAPKRYGKTVTAKFNWPIILQSQ